MTRSDKWQKRDCVERYRAWADACRLACTDSTTKRFEGDCMGVVAFFHLPVPESLSDAKKKALYGTMHRKKPDADNLIKSCADSLFKEDQAIAFMQAFKLYCEEGEEPRTDVFLLCQPTSKPAT